MLFFFTMFFFTQFLDKHLQTNKADDKANQADDTVKDGAWAVKSCDAAVSLDGDTNAPVSSLRIHIHEDSGLHEQPATPDSGMITHIIAKRQ